MSLMDFVPWIGAIIIGSSRVKKIEITKKKIQIVFK